MANKQDREAVVAFLETYGQPQTLQTIREFAPTIEPADMDELVADGVIQAIPVANPPRTDYAPLTFASEERDARRR